MKPLLIIALFTISISAMEWGLLQVALDRKLSEEVTIFSVIMPSSQHLHHFNMLQQSLAKKTLTNKQAILVSRSRKPVSSPRFDGRISW